MCRFLRLPKHSHGYSIIAHVSNGHRACSSLAATQGACARHSLFANSLRSTQKDFAKKIDCSKKGCLFIVLHSYSRSAKSSKEKSDEDEEEGFVAWNDHDDDDNDSDEEADNDSLRDY
jgi:hypothetical protein